MQINTEIVEMAIADRLWTKQQASDTCQISPSTLNRALNGGNISPKIVGKLSRGLDIPVIEIVRSA